MSQRQKKNKTNYYLIMKTKILFTIAMITSLATFAKDKVLNRPAFADGGMYFCPKTVIMGKTSTVIGFKIWRSGDSWTLDSESHLVAEGKTYRMTKAIVYTRSADGKVKSSEPLNPSTHYSWESDSVSAEFEPLAPKVKIFDFIETETSSFNVYGIRLDGKCYPFVLDKPKPYPHSSDEPLCAIEPKYGKAQYTCNVYKHDGTVIYASMFGLNNCFSEDMYLGFTDNSYQIEASRTYFAGVAAPYPFHQFRIMMIPGYETTVSVDATAYTASFAGASKKAIPTHRIIQFEGPIADLQQTRYDERELYYQFAGLSPDTLWDVLQKKIRDIEKTKRYSRRQKEFGRLWAENNYLIHYMNYVAKGTAKIQDSHAADLAILKDGRSFYFINDDKYLGYAHSNHIDGVVTEWMEGFARAMSLAKRIRGLEVMPEAAFDTIPQYFQKELRDMNDSTRVAIERLRSTANEVKVMDTPDCTGEEFINRVVSENPDVVLFFDFWATWCGPCMNGIRAMEPLKAEWVGRPIRFVYVTNESSPSHLWTKQIASMPGIHYRLPNEIWNAIPNLNGIPQYYIYDRQGKRFYEKTGFREIAPLKQKIDEALSK